MYKVAKQVSASVAEFVASPDLFRKIFWVTALRLIVGVVLLIATTVISRDVSDALTVASGRVLFGVAGGTFVVALAALALLRVRRYLRLLVSAQILADVLIASGLVYLTGGAESVFTILYPLAIVNAAIGLSKRGAISAAAASAAGFCLVSIGLNQGWFEPAFSTLTFGPLSPPKLALNLGTNLAAMVLTASLAAVLSEQLRGARQQLASKVRQLAAVEAQHASIVSSIGSGILALDEAGRVLRLNRAGEEICGLPEAKMVGTRLSESLPELAGALEPGSALDRHEVILHTPQGERVLGFSVTPLVPELPEREGGKVVVFQDLTEFRRLEDLMRRSERLAALGQLAAGLAHEIRNPLASMCGSIELLQGIPSLTPRDQTLMQVVLREGHRLEELVRDFLAFARPSPLHPQRVELSRIVDDTLQLFGAESGRRNLQVAVDLSPGITLIADEAQLRQVLWNLLHNAAEASDDGGAIRIRVSLRAGGVELEVADSGQGIPASDLPHIFDPFFTTKSGGSGLGLAIVHRIVEVHGGRIAVRSEPNKGTTFSLWFPLAPPRDATASSVGGAES